MDFPKSVPGVGLVNGRFVDEDALAARPGSLVPSAWGNAITLEILNVLSAAGITPDELKTNQLSEAISKITAGSSVAWAKVSGTPTTALGYGITDVYTKSQIDGSLTGKANKATSLAGYGITDAVSKTSGWQASAPIITGRLDALSGSQLGSAISGSTADFPPQNANSVVSHMTFANATFSADIAVGINNVGGQLLFRGNGPTAGLGVWYETFHTGNFRPNEKVDGDRCTTAGFAGGGDTITQPYMRHVNGSVVYLARAVDLPGLNRSYIDVTGSRSANVSYTNDTGALMSVTITFVVSNAAETASIYVGGALIYSGDLGTLGVKTPVTFLVPKGVTYIVTLSVTTIERWVELR